MPTIIPANPATSPLLAFDTETTGIDPHKERIVTASAVYVPADGNMSQTKVKAWLINPGVEIPAGSTEIHGITNEMAQTNGGNPKELLTDFFDVLTRWYESGNWSVTFNGQFDASVLMAEARRHGITVDPSIFDTMLDAFVFDKVLDKYRPGKRTLETVAAHYGVILSNAHNSDADSIAAALVMQKIFEKYGHLLPDNPADLIAFQRKAKIELAEDLTAYKHKNGDTSFWAPRGWPFRTPETDQNDRDSYGISTADQKNQELLKEALAILDSDVFFRVLNDPSLEESTDRNSLVHMVAKLKELRSA